MNRKHLAATSWNVAALLMALLCVLPLSATNPQKKNMKELNVKKVSLANVAVENVPGLLDKEKVDFQPINTVNWAAYPYCPEVQFRMAHTDDAILLNYRVKEASVRAVAAADNGAVWEDACVEFFCVPAGDGIYYNIECNCAGTLLIGAGPERNNREHAPQEVMDRVQRWASLGRAPFEEKVGECNWELALVIPYSAFFKHQLTNLDGKKIRANFYKCGDNLQTPHFLSWNPIEIENPDFHRPDFFGMLNFE